MDSKKIKFIAVLFSVLILFGFNSTSDFSGNSNDSFSNEDYSQVEDSQILKINFGETKKLSVLQIYPMAEKEFHILTLKM